MPFIYQMKELGKNEMYSMIPLKIKYVNMSFISENIGKYKPEWL